MNSNSVTGDDFIEALDRLGMKIVYSGLQEKSECPECSVLNPYGANYCNYCGYSLSDIHRVFCSYCGEDRTLKGSLLYRDMVFCNDLCFSNWKQNRNG